ncbi:MAG: PEGA domain-containing protein [bacterium]|nr:PEGA domain-containing protein [bacterium]
MTKRAIFISIIGVILLLLGIGLLVKIFVLDGQGVAAVQIQSFPKADVYLNDTKVGQTPYKDEKLKPGDYAVKLTADALLWTGKVKLYNDTITFINRDLADIAENSGGEILTLEKLVDDKSMEVAVVSQPDGAIVKVDGKSVGTAPLTVSDITPGDHEIGLSYPGYRDRFVRGRAVAGYRLNVAVQLGKTDDAPVVTPTPKQATPSATLAKPYVTIKETPTGWLRVRFSPSTSATESGRVNPGDKFPLLDEQTGWAKIRFKDLLEGWVSDSYVEKVK